MFLKPSQKGELGNVIISHGMQPTDFEFKLDEENSAITLKHKESDSYFFFMLDQESYFTIEFVPSATSNKPTRIDDRSWAGVLDMVGSWTGYILDDMSAEDPWADTQASSEFEDDPESLFSPAELKTIDSAIDASFEKLVAEANANGVEKKIDDVLVEIAELKQLARSTPRAKWLERFKGAIAAKLFDWGLDLAIGTGVLDVLYEVAKPVLKLVADL